MKKSLLFLAVAAMGQSAVAQLTQANEPAIGATQEMYFCDSNTVQYDAVTGSSAVWDYTGLQMYFGQTRDLSVLDASTAPNASDFPSATKAISIQNLITTYYNSTPTERTVNGFVYTEASLGTVLARWTTDQEVVMTYPFAFGNTNVDAYAGGVEAIAQTFPATGTVTSTIDGVGTMLFPSGVSVPNVTRLKVVEDGIIAAGFLGNINLVRTQYEYYDLTNSNLPIFMVVRIVLSGGPLPTPSDQSIVLSNYPGAVVGISEKTEIKFSIYPNPANEQITIAGEFQEAKVSIVNAVGQVVINQEVSSGSQINVSSLEAGMYLVRLEKDGVTTVKNISIR